MARTRDISSQLRHGVEKVNELWDEKPVTNDRNFA